MKKIIELDVLTEEIECLKEATLKVEMVIRAGGHAIWFRDDELDVPFRNARSEMSSLLRKATIKLEKLTSERRMIAIIATQIEFNVVEEGARR